MKQYIAHSLLIDAEKGKNIPNQPYEMHIRGVYNNCLNSLKRIEPSVDPKWFPVLRKSLQIASIYHDLGKLDDQAQSFLHGEIKSKMINHVDAGVAFTLSQYSKTKDMSYLIAAYLILAHHIGLPNYDYMFKTERQMLSLIVSPTKSFRDRKSLKKYDMGKNMVKTHVNKNLNNYLKIHRDLCELAPDDVKISKSSALSFISNPLAIKVAISILVDADHEDTSENYGDTYPVRVKHINSKYYLENLQKAVKKMEDDYKNGLISCSKERFNLRQEFYKLCGNVEFDSSFYLVDGTVGIGKTLAIMNLALTMAIKLNVDTLIFILPYIALIDQSAHEYIRCLFDDPKDAMYNLNTIHSIFKTKNVFHRKYNKGFNAPINMTTSVNFFQIISSNHTCVFKNIHKFIGSVIVIDEYSSIASYEFWPSMLKIMNDLAKHFSCKFIFSSGTPVRFWNVDDISKMVGENISVKQVISSKMYKKMIALEKNRVIIRNSIKEEWSFKKLAREILKQKKSTFVILNTRKKTVAFAQELMKKTSRKIYLRFSGLSPKDRIAQFEKIKADIIEQKPIIVIATQGSDIGLDISFYCGFKESSNYDSISQMKGRINRGNEFEKSFLHIFRLSKCPNGGTEIFYNNPAFKHKTEIFESEVKLQKSMSPEYSTYIAEKEIDRMSIPSKDKMNSLIRMWDHKEFENFGDNFSLIDMPMMHLLINPDLFAKMKKDEYVPYNELQNNIVNVIWSEKNMDLLRDHIVLVDDELGINNEGEDTDNKEKKGFYGLYFWKGAYDPENFGIFADPIWGLVDLKTLIV